MAEAPAPEDLERWHKWFAVECNNRAWRLAEQVSRTPAEDEEMLNAAHAAALHWGKVGDELHRARAAILLGQAHALVGDGKRALHYAREAFAYVSSHNSPPWQQAFAHAVMASAAAANDERSMQKTHYQRAKTLGSALTDDEERAIFEATFRTVPVPD